MKTLKNIILIGIILCFFGCTKTGDGPPNGQGVLYATEDMSKWIKNCSSNTNTLRKVSRIISCEYPPLNSSQSDNQHKHIHRGIGTIFKFSLKIY